MDEEIEIRMFLVYFFWFVEEGVKEYFEVVGNFCWLFRVRKLVVYFDGYVGFYIILFYLILVVL